MSDRILIVDDEVEIADLIETYLQSENYTVSNFIPRKKRWTVFRQQSLTWLFWTL